MNQSVQVRDNLQPDIKQFVDFVRESGIRQPATALLEYKNHLRNCGYRSATINKKLSFARGFFRYAYTSGQITGEEYERVKSITNVKDDGEIYQPWLSEEQAKQLFYSIETNTLAGQRDYMLVIMLLILGMRREEAVNAKWEQLVKHSDGTWILKNIVGKGNKIRTVTIPDEYANFMNTLRDEGYILYSVDRWGNKRSNQLTVTAVNYIFTQYSEKLGFDITPHSLRRTHATLFNLAGGDIDELRRQLGHASEATTRRYIQKSFIPNTADIVAGIL